MDDEDSRPGTAHKVLRRAPDGFDDAETSHSKDQFDGTEAVTSESQSAGPSKQQENIPPLLQPPSAPDNTFLDGSSLESDKASSYSFADHPPHDHLPDVESSFVAPISPIPTITRDGPDDTFLFASPSKEHAMPAPDRLSQPAEVQSRTGARSPASSTAADDAERSTRQRQQMSHADAGPRTSALSLERISSPAVSVGARSTASSRPRSRAGGEQHGTDTDSEARQRGGESESDGHMEEQNQRADHSHNHSRSASNSATSAPMLRHRSSDADFHRPSVEAAGGAGHVLRYGKRPRFLKSRDASSRSSISSFITNPDSSHDDIDSDVTVGLGTDYALQSGGAVPALGSSRSISNMLSRSVSIGSMVSAADDFHDSTGRLETLDEDEHGMTRLNGDEDYLQTPKAKGSSLAAPTDTVLARRVMDVQVPESLAREYKSKGGLMTPRKPSEFSVGSTQRTGKNLTLKEQSSTIERLSKENFDLKLKVMFLSDRLDKLSEEGVKEMIQENVEFRTNIAVLQRDNKGLRRRVKELEKQLKDEDERPGTSRSAASSNGQTETLDSEAQDREEELFYLRERVDEYATEIDRLRQENMTKEAEKRRMAEVVKGLQSLGEKNLGENLGRQEEQDVWKDLLEQETARREQADEDNRRLRDEIFKLKQEMANGTAATGPAGLHHTTNIYNISKKPRGMSPSRPVSSFSSDVDTVNGTMSGTSTLIEELRREGEQLRHENAELRREVGAQTSMLTSRNKEKERLYQEIEDLKLAQRRGGPAPSTIDSLLDRSASQMGAHERSASRASGGTRAETALDDAEREELENKNAELRDRINELKLRNQTLTHELEGTLQARQEAEENALGWHRDYEGAMNDLMVMQTERDDLLGELNDLEQKHRTLMGKFEDLRNEAQEAIDGYEEELEMREEEAQKLQFELSEKTEGFNALQEEMRKVSENLVVLEDDQDNKLRRIQQLEHEATEANKELEELEAKLLESNDKAQRLLVQQENSQGEIAFLREEQEGDKINISRLEVSIAKAEEALREEQDRVKQLQAQIVMERERAESLATKDKKEMQQLVNELSREASTAKEEARKLRKNLTSREVEATEWKERLMELENNLREALGDLNGTRSSLLKSIAKLQRELENTVRELDSTKAAALEKDRIIKQRDALLESHSLESRKIAEALEKERVAHRNTKHQFDTFQKTHQHVTRTVTTQDQRIIELETTKSQDKKRIAQLEANFKDQLNERNNLLLVLWTRLSSLCGTDWAHDNSLINGRALPSLEAVATMLPGFSKNLMAAVKNIEAIMGSFQSRIKGVEKDLWREYQNLENNLEVRTKKLERLESIVRNGVASGAFGSTELQNRLLRLEEAYRQLKVENTTLRTANEVRARAAYGAGDSNPDLDANVIGGSPAPSIPTGPRERSKGASRSKASSRGAVSRTNTMTRPMTAGELALQEAGGDSVSPEPFPNDPRWILRLRDLENKLKMEREGRTLDRNEAARRLLEQEAEINRQQNRERRRGRERDDGSG